MRFPLPPSLKRAFDVALPWVLAASALAAGAATYGALTQTPPLGNDPRTVLLLLNIDLVVLLVISTLIARRVFMVRARSRQGQAGAGLQARLIYTFSLLAAVPVVLMTVFSALFFHFGVQAWLSGRVETAIAESRAVARAYLDEHRQVIRADTLAMARDIDRGAAMLSQNPQEFEKFMRTQALVRGLSEALVVDSTGVPLARAGLTLSLEMNPLPSWAMRAADGGEVVVLPSDQEGDKDRVRALVRLGAYLDSYLLVGRAVDAKVLEHVSATEAAVNDYADLQKSYADLRLVVTLVYLALGLLLLMVAIMVALYFARRIGTPIGALIAAADRVRGGDLTIRVAESLKIAEFRALAEAFNRMTSQIERQQTDLLIANRQMDERRKFTETVLSGVSSGVLGLNEEGRITVVNAVAVRLLGLEEKAILGQAASAIMPAVIPILVKGGTQQEAVSWGGRHFLVRAGGTEGGGVVVTFDDITDLEAAQRKAAWGDVARRIAHEIKNPLTPIQLCAERLKRRYSAQITQGADVFGACIDTIIQHVGDIGRMVDEFSAFARMPVPVLRTQALATLIREVLDLQRPAHPDIVFECAIEEEIFVRCDASQIRQALTNLLQNAAEAIDPNTKGRIIVSLTKRGDYAALCVEDNGCGLPTEGDDITQPYVTHKAQGTGLGLAIVQKIVQDHGGVLDLGASVGLGGACVTCLLSLEDS